MSLIAGITVLGVVFFPTARPGLPLGAPPCGSQPEPPGCSPVEQTLGEQTTAHIHAGFAIAFILSLAIVSFLFAASEVLARPEQLRAQGQLRQGAFRNPVLFLIHSACALIILIAGTWAFVGVNIGALTRLYIGEVASVWAFGLSWFLARLLSDGTGKARTANFSGHQSLARTRRYRDDPIRTPTRRVVPSLATRNPMSAAGDTAHAYDSAVLRRIKRLPYDAP